MIIERPYTIQADKVVIQFYIKGFLTLSRVKIKSV